MARRATLRANAGTAMAADGNFTLKAGQNDELDWQGGNGAMYAVGTWGGGTLKLQQLAPDNATWVDIGAGVSFTGNGVGGFTAPAGALRVNLAGSAGASLKAWVVGIPTNNAG